MSPMTPLVDLVAEVDHALDMLTTARTAVHRAVDGGKDPAPAQAAYDYATGRIATAVDAAVDAIEAHEAAGCDATAARNALDALPIPMELRARLTPPSDPATNEAFRAGMVVHQPWPDPQPLRRDATGLPTWPIDVLPTWIGDHVRHAADQLQTPVDLCAQFALGALAAAAMGHARVVLGGRWSEPLNLWLATALPSGGGKSPAEKAMTRPLRQWEAERHEASQADVHDAEIRRRILEKKAKLLDDSASKGSAPMADAMEAWREVRECEVPAPFRMLADDATPEALVQLLARHDGRMAVLSTEAGLLDVVAGTYATAGRMPNIDVYLKGYSGDSIMVDRKGSGGLGTELRIPEPLLTVGLAMQPTVIDFVGRTNGQLEGRGFLARFLYSFPPSMVGHRDRTRVLAEIDDGGAAERYGRALVACASRWQDKDGHVMTFAPDAARRLVEAHQGHEAEMIDGGRLRPVAEWMAKLHSATLRVSGLLHLADREGLGVADPIDVATVERSLTVADYWIDHALSMAATTDTQTADDALAILEVIDRKRLTTFGPREVWLSMRARFRGIEDMVAPLQYLAACGYLRLVEGDWVEIGVRGATTTLQARPRTSTTLCAIEASARHAERKNARFARFGLRVVLDSSSSLSVNSPPLTKPREPRVLVEEATDGVVEPRCSEPVDNPDPPATPSASVAELLWSDT